MDFKVLLYVGVIASGVTEWLKKLLPAKVTEKTPVMAAIAAVISAVGGLIFGLATALTWPQIGIACAVEIGLSQLCYTFLVSTFTALKKKLTSSATPDPDALADEMAEKLTDGIKEAVETAVKKS